MFSKSKEKKEYPSVTNTVIGSGIKFEQNLISGEGSLRVDGNIFSDICIDGDIIVGETGYIKGNIIVENALLAGNVEGNIESKNSVHLTSSSSLKGNVTSSSLVIDEGAIFSGNCHMAAPNQIESDSKPLVYVNSTEPNKEKKDLLEKDSDPNLSFDKVK